MPSAAAAAGSVAHERLVSEQAARRVLDALARGLAAGSDAGACVAAAASALEDAARLVRGEEEAEEEEMAQAAKLQRVEQREAAAFRRRSGPACRHQVGRGCGVGSSRALRRSAVVLYACDRVGCGALVDVGRARDAARRDSRRSFEIGDGCAGVRCAHRHRPREFARRQCALVRAVLDEKRLLARWSTGLGHGIGRRMCRAAALRAAATAIRALKRS
jgi:bacterioferritin-associated ferredoxin